MMGNPQNRISVSQTHRRRMGFRPGFIYKRKKKRINGKTVSGKRWENSKSSFQTRMLQRIRKRYVQTLYSLSGDDSWLVFLTGIQKSLFGSPRIPPGRDSGSSARIPARPCFFPGANWTKAAVVAFPRESCVTRSPRRCWSRGAGAAAWRCCPSRGPPPCSVAAATSPAAAAR